MNFSEWSVAAPSWPTRHENVATYRKPSGSNPAAGLLLAPDRQTLIRGSVSVNVSLPEGLPDSQARIVFGRDVRTGAYMSGGIGGYDALHVIDEFLPGPDLVRPIALAHDKLESAAPREERLTLTFRGRHIVLKVGSVPALEVDLPRPLLGENRLGLFAWGQEPITFTSFRIRRERPLAFVVMQFSGFKTVFEKMISGPLAGRVHVDRVDKHARPGNIPRDIRESIFNADVVIAEITPSNENVFYELGYAQACGVPTILLAQKERRLPFDVGPERCILYPNTTKGRQRAAEELVAALRELGLT
jgi:hypothetical protein